MLRLKKKQPAGAPEASATSANSTASATSTSNGNGDEDSAAPAAISLIGAVGGVNVVNNAEGKKQGKKRSPGEIRIQKDIAELDSGTVAHISFPNPNDLTNFVVEVAPDSGYWVGARYTFNFAIPPLYPHEPPKVTCRTKIYHPNINFEGAVCLNILREDWKPVLDVNAVIYGLIYLFYEPNSDDPLNREAADLFRTDKAQFSKVVKRTLQGYSHAGESFDRLV